jgi:hypothetical protein
MDQAPSTAAPRSLRARPYALITLNAATAPAGAVAATAGERVDMPMAEPPDNEDRLPDAVRTTQSGMATGGATPMVDLTSLGQPESTMVAARV